MRWTHIWALCSRLWRRRTVDVRDLRLFARARETERLRNTLILVSAERDAYQHAYMVLTGYLLPPTDTPSVTTRMRES